MFLTMEITNHPLRTQDATGPCLINSSLSWPRVVISQNNVPTEAWIRYRGQNLEKHYGNNENRELSWCQICCYWWASWQLSVLSEVSPVWDVRCWFFSLKFIITLLACMNISLYWTLLEQVSNVWFTKCSKYNTELYKMPRHVKCYNFKITDDNM